MRSNKLIRILMIEDDIELANILIEYLKQYNIEVTNYETPELGISGLALKKYDLIILDLSLPNIDGIEVCRLIRQRYNIPIIISSARILILFKHETILSCSFFTTIQHDKLLLDIN